MSPQHLSFSKELQRSHLSDRYYLGLPKKFCDANLPGQNQAVILVDENEQEYSVMYSAKKNRLRCGWRSFAVEHNLLEGDTVFFHLIEHCKFKKTIDCSSLEHHDTIPCHDPVHIARASRSGENGFHYSKQVDSVKKEGPIEENASIGTTTAKKRSLLRTVDSHQIKKSARVVHVVKPINTVYKFDSRVPESIADSEPVVCFEDLKGLEDFRILLHGVILDAEISACQKIKYYELCCSQNMFLHDRLIKGLSTKLALTIISETTDIADAIRASNLETPLHQLDCWDRTLKAFEDLGMEVVFLRARVLRLLSISRELQVSIEHTRTQSDLAYERRKDLQEKSVSKIDALSENVTSLQASVEILDDEVNTLKEKNEELDNEYKEVASFSW